MILRPSSTGAALAVALVLLPVAASSAPSPTAQRIIARHINALGGARVLKSVASVRLRGTANESGEFLWQTKAPSSYYLEVRQAGVYTVEAFNGRSAWRDDEAAGARTLTGREQARTRAVAAHRNDHFLTYKKDKTRVRLLGLHEVEGRPAHAVAVTTAEGIQRVVYFDAQTYLILKEEQEGEGGPEEILFGDYRAVGGVQEPHRIRLRRGGVTMELAVQSAVQNTGVDPSLFDFPRRDLTPLPDIAALFKEVQNNQKEVDKAQDNYTYTKTEKEFEIDGEGRVKEKAERTYAVFSVDGMKVEKLVARSGRPLPADEAAKEQERVDTVMREHAEDRKKTAGRKAREEGEGAGKEEREAELTISRILRVCQFVNPRRERFQGQDVVVYDFEPLPGEKPRNRVESWMQKLVGNVWIDEQARQIVRAEARVKEPIKIGGGLVLSVQRGSSFVLEQELVNGEVWLPSYAEVNTSARFLLFKGFKINQVARFTDYKKFAVETSSEISPPRP